MNKKASIIIMSMFCIILSGCSMNKLTETPTPQKTKAEVTAIVLETPKIGIESCDEYLGLIECLAKENITSTGNNYQILYNDFLSSRKDIPATQLELTCQSLTDNLISNPDILEGSSCKL